MSPGTASTAAISCPKKRPRRPAAPQNIALERSRLGIDFLEAGALEPAAVAAAVVDGIRAERFLILPHPEVADFFRRKADDYDRWLRGMRRLQQRLIAGA